MIKIFGMLCIVMFYCFSAHLQSNPAVVKSVVRSDAFVSACAEQRLPAGGNFVGRPGPHLQQRGTRRAEPTAQLHPVAVGDPEPPVICAWEFRAAFSNEDFARSPRMRFESVRRQRARFCITEKDARM